MSLQVWLEHTTSDKFRLPVNPEAVAVSYGWDWSATSLANLSQINVGGGKELAKIELSGFFPRDYIPGISEYSGYPGPQTLRTKLQGWADNRYTIKFILIGDFSITINTTITSFAPKEKAGAPGDIYWDLNLLEYRAPTLRQVQVSQPAVKKPAARKPVTPPPSRKPTSNNKTHTSGEWIYVVKRGDNLWTICQRYYHNPNRCWDLAKKNHIRNPNLIYPNQRLTMWRR